MTYGNNEVERLVNFVTTGVDHVTCIIYCTGTLRALDVNLLHSPSPFALDVNRG